MKKLLIIPVVIIAGLLLVLNTREPVVKQEVNKVIVEPAVKEVVEQNVEPIAIPEEDKTSLTVQQNTEEKVNSQSVAPSETTNTIVWINGVIGDGTESKCQRNGLRIYVKHYTDEEWNSLIKTNPGYLGEMIIRANTPQFFCGTIQESI